MFCERVAKVVLPCGAHLHLQLEHQLLEVLPGKLIRLLSADQEEWSQAAKEVSQAHKKKCCTPRGVEEFVLTLETEQHCRTVQSQCVISELAENMDLHIADVEAKTQIAESLDKGSPALGFRVGQQADAVAHGLYILSNFLF